VEAGPEEGCSARQRQVELINLVRRR